MGETNRTVMRIGWRLHKLLWNATGGKVWRTASGMPVLELVTIGSKPGESRQILITYVDYEGTPAIIGTNAGRDTDPAWVTNLRANPEARARWDSTWHDVTTRELSGDQHDQVWQAAVEANPGYADYSKGLTRPIPIMELTPR